MTADIRRDGSGSGNGFRGNRIENGRGGIGWGRGGDRRIGWGRDGIGRRERMGWDDKAGRNGWPVSISRDGAKACLHQQIGRKIIRLYKAL